MIEKVTAFKTPDGRLHESKKGAEKAILKAIAREKLRAIESRRGAHLSHDLSAVELLYLCEDKCIRDSVFDYLEALEDWAHAPTD